VHTLLSRTCDAVVLCGVAFLVAFAPFAFGGVHPPAYRTIEITALLLLGAWAVRAFTAAPDPQGEPALPGSLLAWLGGFVSLIALQLIPLPPALLYAVSPATHAFYERALPGWPERAPYAEAVEALLEAPPRTDALSVILPTPDDDFAKALDHFFPPGWDEAGAAPGLAAADRTQLESWLEAGASHTAWRPLSIAPARTRAQLGKAIACMAIFLVVTAYLPGGDRRSRQRLELRALRWLVLVAFCVAAIGLLQRATWNGKILWVFIPWDWEIARPEWAQTSGPFVNRSHFANYLALLWPLALLPVFARGVLHSNGERPGERLTALLAPVAMGVALLWSLSRGGWLAALAGAATLIATLGTGRGDTRRRAFTFAVAAGAAALVLALAPLEAPGTRVGNELDLRLEQTVTNTSSLRGRVALWRDSLSLVREHPMLGVGLGAWQDAFPRYDESPRSRTQARRAHNDYIQLLAETGLVGVGLLGAALFMLARLLGRALTFGTRRSRPIASAAVAGTVAVAVHACVDFGLQIPAIPVTLAVLLGIALRESWPQRRRAETPARGGPLFGLALAAGLVLTLIAPDPRAGSHEASVVTALAAVDAAPASVPRRLVFATRALETSLDAGEQILASAVALDPQAPGPRDAHAVALAQLGRDTEALAEIEESVARAPFRSSHAYLSKGTASWLSPAEAEAVERGFVRALPASESVTAASLAGFRRDRREFEAAANAWQAAAERAADDRERARYLRHAGLDLARAGAFEPARAALEASLERDPGSSETYTGFLTQVLGPAADLEPADALIARARRHGVDAYTLELALADAARQAKDPARERGALERALEARPREAAALYRLGRLHVREQAFGPATRVLRRAIDADPRHAAAWHELGLAQERQYHFAPALDALEAAVREAPENERYRQSLARFRKRLDDNRPN
jgi:O-antigen ligase/tetratricopeptide (TPR) repeat protein